MANQETGFFGRRKGRPLNSSRAEAIDTLLPLLRVEDDALSEDGRLDPSSLFKAPVSKTVFEIGFGNGERLAQHMEREPETGFIGAEPFINGMAAFLKAISDLPHDRIRVLMDDALRLARSFSDQSLDMIYVLNPDPWHKVRHHKRRIINQDNLGIFSRILKPGGRLIMTSDVPYLSEWMLTHTMIHPDFEWMANCADDWRHKPQNWIPTRYETKRAKGASCMSYLIFERR